MTADLADAKDLLRIEALLTEREDIDVLINNAGLGALGPTSKITADALENLIRINILALTRLTHAALPGFLRRNSGTIINIASMIAVMPTPSGAGYSGSKAYVLNFTRSLQMELAKTSIIVQAVLPGPVRTEFFEASGLTAAPFPTNSSCPRSNWSIPLSRHWTRASLSAFRLWRMHRSGRALRMLALP